MSRFDLKNVVVDSIFRYSDGDVYKNHIFLVFILNDFKYKKIFINVFIVYLFVVSVPTMDAPAQTLSTAKKSKSV